MLQSDLHPAGTDPEPLVSLLRGRRIAVLAGAGCSTESGIPDYRGPEGRLQRRSPIQYREFVGSGASRARYWARATVGWSRVARAEPNDCHRSLAALEVGGAVRGVITQNVDGLHQAAGSRRVIELHGSLAFVRCLDCGTRLTRERMQERLVELNGEWLSDEAGARTVEMAPDGDAEVEADRTVGFRVPECETCRGMLKPDVVFFGENVPKDRVGRAWRLLDEADALLVLGSSLTVYSGRRFVYKAAEVGIPIAVVNLGPTRGDDMATVKVDGRLGAVLPAVAEAVLAG